MAQAADQGTAAGAPFIKFANCGDRFVGAFAGGKSRQQQDFDSKEYKTKPDGKPLLEEVMHLVAMPGSTAGTGRLDEGLTPAEVSAHVRFAVSGYKWKQVIDARKALPAYAGFAAGTSCSGDIYEITLVGWSAETKNPQAAINAGFIVTDGRIILRSQEAKDAYVLAQSRSGGNTNPARDYEITVRRPSTAEKRFEQEADALFATKPWERQPEPAMAGGGSSDDEPF